MNAFSQAINECQLNCNINFSFRRTGSIGRKHQIWMRFNGTGIVRDVFHIIASHFFQDFRLYPRHDGQDLYRKGARITPGLVISHAITIISLNKINFIIETILKGYGKGDNYYNY